MTGRTLSFMGVLFIALLPVNAHAQLSRDSEAPLDVTSAYFEAVEGQNYMTWTGNVHAVQGEVILTTPKLVLYQKENGDIDRVEAMGGVRYTNATEKISGQKMVYNADEDTITVTGKVVVLQGDQVMSGEKLVYNLANGSLIFSGQGKTRVRGIFFQNKSDGKTSS